MACPFLEPAESLAGHAGVGTDFFDHEGGAGSIGSFGFLNSAQGGGDARTLLGFRRACRNAVLAAVTQLFKSVW